MVHSFGCKQGAWQLCLGCGAHVCACHGIGHGNCPECYVGILTNYVKTDCRKNGAVKTWVTRPGEWKMPVKHGLKDCFYIGTASGCEPPGNWCTPAKWPAEHVIYGGM